MEIERNVWTKKGVEHYHEECKGWRCTQSEAENIWAEIRNKVESSTMKIKKK